MISLYVRMVVAARFVRLSAPEYIARVIANMVACLLTNELQIHDDRSRSCGKAHGNNPWLL